MKAAAKLQVVPLAIGVSVRPQITRVVDMLKGHDLIIDSHASGTDIEGELTDILNSIWQIHETLHKEGDAHLLSYLEI